MKNDNKNQSRSELQDTLVECANFDYEKIEMYFLRKLLIERSECAKKLLPASSCVLDENELLLYKKQFDAVNNEIKRIFKI